MLDPECSESIGTNEDLSEQPSSPDNTDLMKTTTKPRKTTIDIIVGDYEGRYKQDLAIVDAKANINVTSVNGTLEYATLLFYLFMHVNCNNI